MGKVIYTHPAWARHDARPREHGNIVWPNTCSQKEIGERIMADITRGPSHEYWRPAPSAGSPFRAAPTPGNETGCAICGTPYAIGAHFCHACGMNREDALERRNPFFK